MEISPELRAGAGTTVSPSAVAARPAERNGQAPAFPAGPNAAANGDAASLPASSAGHAVARPALADRRYITAAMMLVMVLASMEMTVTSTAMPTIIGELHGLAHYSWVASIYLLACTVSMPLYGRLADAWGRKRVVLAAIGLFCAASALAAASRSMTQLIVFRGLQGLGAGGIMPVVLTILGDIFTLEERARIQGAFSAVWGGAALAGPALGAVLVNTLGWRWVFLINLPLGAAGLAVLAWKYHDREKPHTTDLDLPGIALLAAACGAVLALVSGLGPGGWSPPVVAGLLVTAVLAAVGFVRVERGAANPVLPPSLLLHRVIGPSMVGSFLLGICFLGVDTYVPLYVQGAKGGGAAAAAWVVTPVMLAWATSGIFAATMVIRWGFRRTAVLGSGLTVLSFAGLVACAAADAPSWVLTLVLLAAGLGFGPASMSYLLASQGAVAWQQRGIVTSNNQFFRTIGGAIGIGLLGMMFNVLAAARLEPLRAAGVNVAGLLDPHARAAVPAETLRAAGGAIAHGLTWVFVAMLVAAVAQLGVTLLMPGRSEPVVPEG